MTAGKFADPKVTDAAEAALNAYLQAYPQGLYAGSARGLLPIEKAGAKAKAVGSNHLSSVFSPSATTGSFNRTGVQPIPWRLVEQAPEMTSGSPDWKTVIPDASQLPRSRPTQPPPSHRLHCPTGSS